jgi:hypothetical protein
MITYWKSNAKKEFGFFGQKVKNKSKLNDIELIQRVTEVLAETDNADKEEEDEYEDNSFDKSRSRIEKPVRRTINGEIIPDDNVIVLIKNVWIENEIDLSNDIILKDIGNIPKDLDDFIDNEKNNNENIVLTDDETVDDTNGRGILNYNVNDLLDECINEN